MTPQRDGLYEISRANDLEKAAARAAEDKREHDTLKDIALHVRWILGVLILGVVLLAVHFF